MSQQFPARNGTQQQISTWLVTEECCQCHMLFAMPSDFRRRMLEKKEAGGFYCPQGHLQHFLGQTEVARLKALVEAEQKRTEWARAQKHRAERQAAAAKGRVTRIKNKIARGECPSCGKKFQDLTRHMALAHPQFEHDEDAHG